ncbi:MAG: sensor histidine kinase [Anaerolineae bacterium]|nr:sensor histidine kinase [Anaerolineae bacterium]
MTDKTTLLDQFVTDATAVLRETEQNLQKLAQAALLRHQELYGGKNGRAADSNEPAARRLQQISQQLAKLSQRSHTLQTYLQHGLEAPPADDDEWPRIRILQSHEEERAQLARELEDGVGQLLANAVFELASCRHLLGGHNERAVADGLDALQSELEQGLADVRHFILNLEPAAILGNFGLGEGVRRYLERFETRTGLKTQLRVNTNIGRLPSIIEITIFRVIQEALLNIQRHANADTVEVIFSENDGFVEFTIIDDGDGFASDRVDGSRKTLGLARMVDYTDLLSGRLKILSEPGQGTQVTLSIPYAAI